MKPRTFTCTIPECWRSSSKRRVRVDDCADCKWSNCKGRAILDGTFSEAEGSPWGRRMLWSGIAIGGSLATFLLFSKKDSLPAEGMDTHKPVAGDEIVIRKLEPRNDQMRNVEEQRKLARYGATSLIDAAGRLLQLYKSIRATDEAAVAAMNTHKTTTAIDLTPEMATKKGMAIHTAGDDFRAQGAQKREELQIWFDAYTKTLDDLASLDEFPVTEAIVVARNERAATTFPMEACALAEKHLMRRRSSAGGTRTGEKMRNEFREASLR